jgi:hypothetical protein
MGGNGSVLYFKDNILERYPWTEGKRATVYRLQNGDHGEEEGAIR